MFSVVPERFPSNRKQSKEGSKEISPGKLERSHAGLDTIKHLPAA